MSWLSPPQLTLRNVWPPSTDWKNELFEIRISSSFAGETARWM